MTITARQILTMIDDQLVHPLDSQTCFKLELVRANTYFCQYWKGNRDCLLDILDIPITDEHETGKKIRILQADLGAYLHPAPVFRVSLALSM